MSLRAAHRVIALTAAIVLTSSAVTGILWAYTPYLYLRDGYMRKTEPTPSPAPREAVLGIHDALRVAEQALGQTPRSCYAPISAVCSTKCNTASDSPGRGRC